MQEVTRQKRAKRTLTAECEPNSLHDRLRQLERLSRGWDGYAALPPNAVVSSNARAVFDSCALAELANWQLFPEVNGTLMLQNDKAQAGFNIGDTAFSYFFIHDNQCEGEDNILFDADHLVKILRSINAA